MQSARRKAGLSLQDVAARLNVSRQAVHQSERLGLKTWGSICRYAEALGCDPNWLVAGSEQDIKDIKEAKDAVREESPASDS